jgi:hydrogenase small subunit
MANKENLNEFLAKRGVSRREFLKFCAVTGSALALPAHKASVFAQALGGAPRPVVIWLSGQECTGCSESLLRSYEPSVETLILDHLSLDYHNTLMAPAGTAAEASREAAIGNSDIPYVVVVDGSIPLNDNGFWSAIGGRSALEVVRESVAGAALVLGVGNCASFGGVAAANPNPSDARGVDALMKGGLIPTKPLINIPGCPPMPEVLTGTIAHFLAFGTVPALDEHLRPTVYYGKTVHDCCSRIEHFKNNRFASAFDDEGARQGFCLALLGCRGMTTRNACSALKWNQGTSYPMYSGHGCIGCSEPGFWDKSDLYGDQGASPDPEGVCVGTPEPPIT